MRVFNNPRVANATALLSLVVALSGTAYAANTVRSADIVNGQVKTKDLAKNAVKSAQVKDGSLTAADLAAGTLPKTAAFSSFRNETYQLPDTSGYLTALELKVPAAGAYVIWGKLVVNNNSDAKKRPLCQVRVGANVLDFAWVGMDDNSGSDDVATAPLMTTANLSGPATVVLECQKPSAADTITVEQRKLVALKVGSLTNTAATGPSRPARAEAK